MHRVENCKNSPYTPSKSNRRWVAPTCGWICKRPQLACGHAQLELRPWGYLYENEVNGEGVGPHPPFIEGYRFPFVLVRLDPLCGLLRCSLLLVYMAVSQIVLYPFSEHLTLLGCPPHVVAAASLFPLNIAILLQVHLCNSALRPVVLVVLLQTKNVLSTFCETPF